MFWELKKKQRRERKREGREKQRQKWGKEKKIETQRDRREKKKKDRCLESSPSHHRNATFILPLRHHQCHRQRPQVCFFLFLLFFFIISRLVHCSAWTVQSLSTVCFSFLGQIVLARSKIFLKFQKIFSIFLFSCVFFYQFCTILVCIFIP